MNIFEIKTFITLALVSTSLMSHLGPPVAYPEEWVERFRLDRFPYLSPENMTNLYCYCKIKGWGGKTFPIHKDGIEEVKIGCFNNIILNYGLGLGLPVSFLSSDLIFYDESLQWGQNFVTPGPMPYPIFETIQSIIGIGWDVWNDEDAFIGALELFKLTQEGISVM
jgi:hypothetical protein